MKFRPCIDLHQGKVKQIVGSTLNEVNPHYLKENFVSDRKPSWYSKLYKKYGMTGGHIIMLGPGNEEAALDALQAWPGGMQLGGGVSAQNAEYWLEKGASAVIVTSWVFHEGRIHWKRLEELAGKIGTGRLVLDLSCRKRGGDYFIVTDRWQKYTDEIISGTTLKKLSGFCCEFLVHAADVEGKCKGVDLELVALLGEITPLPTTYAGGAKSAEDLYLVKDIGKDKLDLTIGSALDIFGGESVKFDDVVDFHKKYCVS